MTERVFSRRERVAVAIDGEDVVLAYAVDLACKDDIRCRTRLAVYLDAVGIAIALLESRVEENADVLVATLAPWRLARR